MAKPVKIHYDKTKQGFNRQNQMRLIMPESKSQMCEISTRSHTIEITYVEGSIVTSLNNIFLYPKQAKFKNAMSFIKDKHRKIVIEMLS